MALLLGSSVLVLGALEAGLRIAYAGAAPYFLSRIVTHHPVRGWSLVPGLHEFFNTWAFARVRMSINAIGLRGAPLSLRPAPPRRRITVLGDSFVFSEGLSDGMLFTDELQRLLGPGCEVVNAGVPGYGTGQELLLVEDLRARGFELGDTAVLVFFTNDLSDNAGLSHTSLDRDRQRPSFEVRSGQVLYSQPEPFPAAPAEAISAGLAKKSLLAALISRRIEILAASNPWIVTALSRFRARVPVPRPPGVILAWYSSGWEERWTLTRDLLQQLARAVARDGSELMIAFQPSPFQAEQVFQEVLRSHSENPFYAGFLADIDRPQRLLLEFCAGAGLRCTDLTPTLRAPRNQPAFFLNEGHLNALGSSLVAKDLYAALKDRC